MTKPRRSRSISRGRRLSSVDYTLLSIPTVGFLALLVPLVLSLLYYAPMDKQEGTFTAVDCTRTSDQNGEAGYACAGEFEPIDGSEPITRCPYWFSTEGKILEAGDTLSMTLYDNDELVREGSSPTIYSIMYVAGGSFAFVGVFIVWAYIVRWFRSGKDEPEESADEGTDIDTSVGVSRLTGLPRQLNGWDAEPPAERRSRGGLVFILLVISVIGSVIGLASAGIAQLQRNATPSSGGVVTVGNCAVSLDLDFERHRPYVYCDGQFVADESNDADAYTPSGDRVSFEPFTHKAYTSGEAVPVTVYQDGAVRDSAGPDPRAIPGIAWGITLAFVSLLLGGVTWLSRSAAR